MVLGVSLALGCSGSGDEPGGPSEPGSAAPPACLMDFAAAPEGVTTMEDLLTAMDDRERLTRTLDERVAMSTSYDRRSDAGDWFANADAGHFQAVEGDRGVLLRRDGPGVVSRIWSANPNLGGDLRVVVDGVTVIDAPMDAVLRGDALGLPDDLAYKVVRGNAIDMLSLDRT